MANAWEHRKGLDDFIMLSKNLDEKFQIILIGIDDKLKQQIPENIISLKRTNSQRELAAYYAMSDVFINPTKEDNYPTTNIESIACGTPVITYFTGGSPESASLFGKVISKEELTKTVKEFQKSLLPMFKESMRMAVSNEIFIQSTIKLYEQ